MKNFLGDNVYYGVKEVPNIFITCIRGGGKTNTVLYSDVIRNFSFENTGNKIICKIEIALADNTFWTEMLFNNLNNLYCEYKVKAETFKRNATTGQDERFFILDNYSFDKMAINFFLSAEGNPASPVITLTKELNNG